jgi:hypothetical protein
VLLEKLFFSSKIVSKSASLVVQVDPISKIKFQVLDGEHQILIS